MNKLAHIFISRWKVKINSSHVYLCCVCVSVWTLINNAALYWKLINKVYFSIWDSVFEKFVFVCPKYVYLLYTCKNNGLSAICHVRPYFYRLSALVAVLFSFCFVVVFFCFFSGNLNRWAALLFGQRRKIFASTLPSPAHKHTYKEICWEKEEEKKL